MADRLGTAGPQFAAMANRLVLQSAPSTGHGGKVPGRSAQSIGHGGESAGLRKVWRQDGGPGRKVPHKAPDQEPPKKAKINYKQNNFASLKLA